MIKKYLFYYLIPAVFMHGLFFFNTGFATPIATGVEKKRIAVLDFATNNVYTSYSKIVRNFIEIALFNTGEFQLVERANIYRIFKEKNISAPSYQETDKIVQTGKQLASDYIVVGSIDKIKNYQIIIRVVSIDNGKIIVAYAKEFNKESDIDSVSQKLADRTGQDIKTFIRTGRLGKSFYDFSDVFFHSKFQYIMPGKRLEDIIKPGFGVSARLGGEHLFFDDFSAGLEFGYYAFSGRKNSQDNCSFIPITLAIGYKINFTNRFYSRPHFAAGYNIITLRHGTGEGFAFNENSSRTSLDPLIFAGIDIGFQLKNTLHFSLSGSYAVNFEQDSSLTFSSIAIGIFFIY